jgi:large subunit ribosomal protein L31e
MAEEIERIYIIPLKKTGFKSSKAAPTAIKRVRSYLTRHMKVQEKDIWIDDSLNNAIWSQGKYKMANKIRVKAVKFDDGVVEAYLPELEFKKSRRELLKEEKAKKEPILKKEEAAAEGAETGAEDYEIAPTADGDVKIKKKKAPRKKEEKPSEEKPAKKKEKKAESKKDDLKEEKKPVAKKTAKKPLTKKTPKKTKKGEKAGKK